MKNYINVIIVDDEVAARDLIKHYLRDYSNINIIGEAENGFDAIKKIKEYKPHLIFLDIQMPKLTGFELLELLDNPPEIIFSTAYDQYAVYAFEQNAIDYLLKPYSKERFDAAMQKVLKKMEAGDNNQTNMHILKETLANHPDKLTRIAVKKQQQIVVININDIKYIEAYGDYVKLHTNNGSFLKEKTMKYFEESLPLEQFSRIHRCSIVNIDEVDKIELYEKESYRVHLKNGIILKASANGYKLLKQAVRL